MQNIKDFILIINNRITKLVLIYLSIIFCVIVSFMLGRLTTLKISKPDIKVVSSNYFENKTSATSTENNSDQEIIVKNTVDKSFIFASKKGKYFYYKGCGGNTISKKNLVYYKSESQAVAAGKIIYSKCK